MIVCICHAVSDRDVRAAAAAGAGALEDLPRLTGAGTSCGSCRAELELLAAEALRAHACAGGCPGCPERKPATRRRHQASNDERTRS